MSEPLKTHLTVAHKLLSLTSLTSLTSLSSFLLFNQYCLPVFRSLEIRIFVTKANVIVDEISHYSIVTVRQY